MRGVESKVGFGKIGKKEELQLVGRGEASFKWDEK